MNSDIIISGIAGRYPGSDSIDQLKNNLYENKDLITEDGSRWPPGLYGLPLRHGKISDINKFDTQFFGIHGKQANTMCPQFRILLEKTYEAILDSGTPIKSIYGSRTGVFIGASLSETHSAALSRTPDVSGFVLPGCEMSMFANRISYCLDLKGPSYTINTACSSSAMALHQAIINIKSGNCDQAIVGGTSLTIDPGVSVTFNKMNMLSPEGKCQFLDQSANGYVRSEACSVIFIQKSVDAKRIYAIVVSIMANTEGFKEQGITYPSSHVQSLLMKSALEAANVSPNSVMYIEAHGTGTQVGDQCEMEAIARAYCTDRKDKQLLVGSVKTNLGHSEEASALTSIAKVLIAFENNCVPASIHFRRSNSNIKSLTSGLIIPVTENTQLEDNPIIGINSFGFGGADVNMLLMPNNKLSTEEDFRLTDKIPRIIPVFGRTEGSVKYMIESMKENSERMNKGMLKLLDEVKDTPGMNYRSFILGKLVDNGFVLQTDQPIGRIQDDRPLWFIFPGMGSQWPGIARGLMCLDIFRESLEKSNEVLKPYGFDLIQLLNDESTDMNDIINSFVTITATQIALIDLLRELDITPDGFVGHSLGEIACGYCDGGIERQQTLVATYLRARLLKETQIPKGLMAAIGLSWKECQQRCPERVFVACNNSEDSVTISGEFESTSKFVEQLREENVFAKEVNSCGFALHSPIIGSISRQMSEQTNQIITKPKRRSNKWISSSVPESQWDTELAKYCSADYYHNNMTSPVLFHQALQHVPRNAVVVEVAPHSLLQSIIRKSLGSDIAYIPLMRRNNNSGNLQMILSAIGRLYQLGFNPRIDRLYTPVSYPVSRGTPSLSPLIQWDHSEDWFVPLYPDYFNSSNSSEYKVTIDLDQSEDAFYADHCIDGQIIFPATGYLVLVWQMLAESANKPMNECRIEFVNVKIHHATILNRPGKTVFSIQINPNREFFLKNQSNLVCSGKAAILDQWTDDNTDQLKRMEEECIKENPIMLNNKEYYKECRIRGYDYGPEFRLMKECTADGRHIKMIFNGNWVTFLDCIFQLFIFAQDIRTLLLPVGIESLRFDPIVLSQSLKVNNGIAMFDLLHDPIIKLSIGHGLQIRTAELKVAKRKVKPCNMEKYKFVPNQDVINGQDIDNVIMIGNYLTKRVVRNLNLDENIISEIFLNDNHQESSNKLPDLSNISNKHTMINLLKNNIDCPNNLIGLLKESLPSDIDIMATDQLYSDECFIRPLIDIPIENCWSSPYNVLELGYTHQNNMIKGIKVFVDNSSLNVSASYKLAIDNKERIDSVDMVGIEVIDWKQAEYVSPAPNWSDLVIFKHPMTCDGKNNKLNMDKIMACLFNSCKENGFCMVIVRTGATACERLVHNLLNRNIGDVMEKEVIDAAIGRGFVEVGSRIYSNLCSIILLRKVVTTTLTHQTFVTIIVDKFERWIDTLKRKLKECKNRPIGHNVWLIANDDPHSGIIGFVNCLRREPGGQRIRCLLLIGSERNNAFDPNAYSNVFSKDLLMNVVIDGELGSFRHFTCNEELSDNAKDCSHAYINVAKSGDLSSLKWFESDHRFWPIGQTSGQKIINVYYSALNFRDIMLSTGKLSADALPGDLSNSKCVLGLEFTGRDQNGQRVFGMVPAKALATTVVVNSTDFLWPIPDHWSMEDASTVAVAYCTAYYALVLRGRLRKGETVLIHSGSGAVGQAAIRIASSMHCKVFTTVGNEEKRKYLVSIFPKLNRNSFANSRDNSFRNHVMRQTNGKGVDLVLNSLAEEKLMESVKCLANHGRFLEIGKYDMMKDNPLGLSEFLKNIEFHGILLDAMFEDSDRIKSDKRQLIKFMSDGMASGAIMPLERTVFDVDEAEQAFRYMASGKHIGKVLIKIRPEETSRLVVPDYISVKAISSTLFSPKKSYIIIGGLGGFGLELLQWMAEKGAKKVVISSRNGLKDNFQKYAINRVQKLKTQVMISDYDITSKIEASKLIDLAEAMGPVGGIFNVAMVLSDGLFDDLTTQRFQTVCKPKVDITRNMDAMSRQKCPNLDYFVVFSSISCGRGNAGQSNYGFANSVMERICESRRRHGLHGLAIQWGPIGDVGVVAENVSETDFEIAGSIPQRINSCLEVLDLFLQSDEPVLATHTKAVRKEATASAQNTDLITKVCNILGIKDNSSLSPNTTLAEMGMDSLMAAEVNQTLEMNGFNMSAQELRAVTVRKLIEMSKGK